MTHSNSDLQARISVAAATNQASVSNAPRLHCDIENSSTAHAPLQVMIDLIDLTNRATRLQETKDHIFSKLQDTRKSL
jgi:hypothetical protein